MAEIGNFIFIQQKNANMENGNLLNEPLAELAGVELQVVQCTECRLH